MQCPAPPIVYGECRSGQSQTTQTSLLANVLKWRVFVEDLGQDLLNLKCILWTKMYSGRQIADGYIKGWGKKKYFYLHWNTWTTLVRMNIHLHTQFRLLSPLLTSSFVSARKWNSRPLSRLYYLGYMELVPGSGLVPSIGKKDSLYIMFDTSKFIFGIGVYLCSHKWSFSFFSFSSSFSSTNHQFHPPTWLSK